MGNGSEEYSSQLTNIQDVEMKMKETEMLSWYYIPLRQTNAPTYRSKWLIHGPKKPHEQPVTEPQILL